MNRRTLLTAAAGAVLAASEVGSSAAATGPITGYAPVNGLQMYYEIHGSGGVPLVLIHGAFSAIGTSFGALLPGLSASRQVIAVELQAHGRTADIDRPMSYQAFADDVAALLDHLKIPQADVFGYSVGAAVALEMVFRHPGKVRRVIPLSAAHRLDGLQPGLMEGMGEMTWEIMKGSPWYEEYQQIAPRPQDFPVLFAKKSEMDKTLWEIPDEVIAAIKQPVLVAVGDADLTIAEHAIRMFRLLGGGGFGDLPTGRTWQSELLSVPNASHVGVVFRADVLVPAITAFLDKP
jgi:pimeloyl-ACP methyl ester carboxylesterase